MVPAERPATTAEIVTAPVEVFVVSPFPADRLVTPPAPPPVELIVYTPLLLVIMTLVPAERPATTAEIVTAPVVPLDVSPFPADRLDTPALAPPDTLTFAE